MLIAFEGLSQPIALDGCDELHGCLTSVLRGWRTEPAASTEAEPVITIRKKSGSFRLETPLLGPPRDRDSDVGMVCAFIADLVTVYAAEQTSLLWLHCGAAAFPGGLVIFPSSYRAGKSTLLARLATAGVAVFADDVLPIDRASNEAIALGVAPRLRLPVPSTARHSFRRFVQAHRGPNDGRYLYLDLSAPVLAQHGSRMPVKACVLLDRSASGPARLEPTATSDALQRLVLQNFARTLPASEIIGCLQRLVGQSACFTLRYADLEDAVALLQDAFEREPPVPAITNGASTDTSAPARRHGGMTLAPRPLRPPRRRPAAVLYWNEPMIQSHVIDGDSFLVDPRNQSILHLNAVATGLWRLLRRPTSAVEAAEVLSGAFPEVDPRQIQGDVQALLGQLLARNMILSQQPGEAKGDCSGS